jgi:hypothetical protein
LSVVKKLGWILGIRRAVFAQHNRPLVPGSITLLAPHYKEGMERMYSDLARVTRFVKPDSMDAEAIGSAEVAEQMNKGAYLHALLVVRGQQRYRPRSR